MSLDAVQVALVQQSWRRISPIGDTGAQLFYGQLFELKPELKALFKSDMVDQGRQLMAMIDAVVSRLTDPEALVSVVRELGRRHSGYGAQAEDYAHAGEALLWTLQLGLGDDFTPELREAWTTFYEIVARVMQGGL